MDPQDFLQAPKQDRSRRTLERILRSATELIAEQGVEETTIHQIVDRAGSSVGSFYARFKGKDDLLDYLEHQAWEGARAHWEGSLDVGSLTDLPLADLIANVVALLHESASREARVRRALRMRHGVGAEPAGAHSFGRRVLEDVRGLLLSKREAFGHPDPDLAVSIGLQMVLAGLPALRLVEGLDEEARVTELTRMLLGYLGAEARGPAKPIDFFDVWA